MGSCVSRSGATPAAAAEPAPEPTAKVVDIDGGAIAQFSAPVTAREALAATAAPSSSHARFLCCSDDLDFNAPVRALDARDALQPGQLYFALPVSMLGRPLPAHEMAALAVKACAALGGAAAPAVAAAVPASRDKSGAAGAAGDKQRRWQATGRVSPLVVVSARADVEWKSYDVHGGGHDVIARMAVHVGDRTVGKSSQAVAYKGVAPRLASVQRLSVIIEAASE